MPGPRGSSAARRWFWTTSWCSRRARPGSHWKRHRGRSSGPRGRKRAEVPRRCSLSRRGPSGWRFSGSATCTVWIPRPARSCGNTHGMMAWARIDATRWPWGMAGSSRAAGKAEAAPCSRWARIGRSGRAPSWTRRWVRPSSIRIISTARARRAASWCASMPRAAKPSGARRWTPRKLRWWVRRS